MPEDKNNQEGIDLSGAFRDPRVEFRDEGKRSAQIGYPATPKIVRWTIKFSGGVIQNEKQASYVLFAFVAAAIIVSLVLVFGGIAGSQKFTPENFTPVTRPAVSP